MRTERFEFPKSVRELAWQRAMGRCEVCTQPFSGRRCEYDHVIPAALRTENSATLANIRVLCPKCHREKTLLEDMPRIVKAKRIYEEAANLRAPKRKIPSRPFKVQRVNARKRRETP